MKIKSVIAKKIKDSRGEETIEVKIETNLGFFSSSAPNGKSKGKNEVKSYKKSLDEDIESIKKISEYFSKEHLEKFEDLKYIEDISKGHLGGNTVFALESAVLKAISKEQKKEIWEIINSKAEKSPRFVGNVIGGGIHSKIKNKSPDFQEFLIIADEINAKESFEKLKKIKENLKIPLKQKDPKFKEEKNDEDAWITSLNEKEILDILSQTNEKIGVDIAAQSFYKRKKYRYKNPPLDRNSEEQFSYISNLIKNFNLFYVEDPFGEEEFEYFKKLLEKNEGELIVGDDLTTTNPKRLKKAIKEKSINAIIIKPNQIGSLIQVKEIVRIAKENNIKTIFSHRSGETEENILADLAFGFEADFLKCGVTSKVRESKIKRIIEIEESLNNSSKSL